MRGSIIIAYTILIELLSSNRQPHISNGATCCNPVEVVVLAGSEPVLVSLYHRMVISLVIHESQFEDVVVTFLEVNSLIFTHFYLYVESLPILRGLGLHPQQPSFRSFSLTNPSITSIPTPPCPSNHT